MKVKIDSPIGWLMIIFGLIIAIYGCLQLPLPFNAGTIAFVGATVAILGGILYHKHKGR